MRLYLLGVVELGPNTYIYGYTTSRPSKNAPRTFHPNMHLAWDIGPRSWPTGRRPKRPWKRQKRHPQVGRGTRWLFYGWKCFNSTGNGQKWCFRKKTGRKNSFPTSRNDNFRYWAFLGMDIHTDTYICRRAKIFSKPWPSNISDWVMNYRIFGDLKCSLPQKEHYRSPKKIR